MKKLSGLLMVAVLAIGLSLSGCSSDTLTSFAGESEISAFEKDTGEHQKDTGEHQKDTGEHQKDTGEHQ